MGPILTVLATFVVFTVAAGAAYGLGRMDGARVQALADQRKRDARGRYAK